MGNPIGRFSPQKGIVVDSMAESSKVTGTLEMYGPGATPAAAKLAQDWINMMWTKSFADGYQIQCDVRVVYRADGAPSAGNAFPIEVKEMTEDSFVNPVLGYMKLDARDDDAFTLTVAHEFGHVIGLGDRYSESFKSKVKSSFGGQRDPTPPNPGYETNLMATTRGSVERRNLDDLASENQPSPYWINDDDQIRDWVTGHATIEIDKLSAVNKVLAIRTLMGGWISDDDMAAIKRICESVTSKAHAKAIRDSIDLLAFSSIGQRTLMKVYLAKMP
jgi:hypothetical protein